MKQLILMSCACVLLSINVEAQGNLLKRVKQQADVVAKTYGETWNTFYGDGHYKNLMTASLDTRPDGTPNIVLDEAAGKMAVTIRLSVNEANYNAWKEATHKRFKDANLSYSFSDFEDTEGRMIGGKNYKFGENEEKSIHRWESDSRNAYKAKLTVHVQVVNDKGKVIRENFVPLEEFERLGFKTFPIPLHTLNRLKDLPASRFHWFETNKEPLADRNVEDAYTKIMYQGLSKSDMDALDGVKCEILDEIGMKPFREKWAAAERKAREALDAFEALCKSVENGGSTEAIIPEGITEIPSKVFEGCSGLTSVTIPSSVTSIGSSAFSGCSGLTSVTIPSSVTSIGAEAFSGCTGLKSVTIPSSVTSIGAEAFCDCSGLTSVTIPSSVTSIGECAFLGCSGLEVFYVDGANPSYKSVNGLLLTKDGTRLISSINENVTIPSSVERIGKHAFYGCSRLTSVTIPSNVERIGEYAFFDCSGLTSVTIPSSVTSIGECAFLGCSGLTSVTIPNGVTSIGENAFYDCRGLTSVTIPNSVTIIGGGAFDGCEKLTTVHVDSGDEARIKHLYRFSGQTKFVEK